MTDSHERCKKIINELVECLKEACEKINETGIVPIKWRKAIIQATGKSYRVYRKKS